MNILVVEDDQNLLDIIKIFLESEGHLCICANTVNESLSFVKSIRFDLALVDWIMREEDTWLLCNHLKSLSLRTVLVSAAIDLPKIAEQLQVEFISKPFELTDIEKLLTPNNK